MNRFFDYLGLPVELQGEIFNLADLPSRLALALTSASTWTRFYSLGIKKTHSNFDSWIFVDECARLGYLELLQWSHSLGARLDVQVVEVAVESGQAAVATWLLKTLKAKFGYVPNIFYARENFPGERLAREFGKTVARKGMIGLAKELLSDEKELASNLLTGGHYALAQSVTSLPLTNVSEVGDSGLEYGLHATLQRGPYDLLSAYALRGEVSLFRNKWQSQKGPKSRRELMFLLHYVLAGDSIELLRLMYEQGLQGSGLVALHYRTIFVNVLSTQVALKRFISLDCIRYFLEVINPESNEQIYAFHFACISASLDVVKFCWPANLRDISNLEVLFNTDLRVNSPSKIKFMRETRADRMKCIEYAYDRGLRWRRNQVRRCALWASYEDILWLLDQATGDFPLNYAYDEILHFHLSANLVADLRFFTLALEKAESLSRQRLFVELAFLRNSVEILEAYGEALMKLSQGSEPLGVVLISVLSGYLNSLTYQSGSALLLDKRRPRPRQWARVVELFFGLGLGSGLTSDFEALLFSKVDALRKAFPEFDPEIVQTKGEAKEERNA